MSVEATKPVGGGDRLLTFEVCGALYALPISQVLEVAEAGQITCVPTLPRHYGGVMNWHGDALPVLSPASLLDRESEGGEETSRSTEPREGCGEHVLVVSDRGDATPRLGLPIDQVHGLVDGPVRSAPDSGVVVERRSMDGRVVSVLDPQGLVARAGDVIEEAVR